LAKTKTPVPRALALELEKLAIPAVLRYDVARLVWNLYRAQSHGGQDLGIRRETPDSRALARLEKALLNDAVLRPIAGFPKRSVYALFGGNLNDYRAVCCSVDPFCYVSHLSAMEYHGITDRLPEQLYISSPPGTQWTSFAIQRMSKDLGEDLEKYESAGLPLLRRVAFTKIGARTVHRYASSHHGAYRSIKDTPVRVATIGRTFLDMLREPGLCGGILHVLEVFQEHAPANRRLIFDELDQQGSPIDKVRAGYILEELCKIQDPRIESWIQFAARGGSRKLDATSEYSSRFSERWCLSLNVPMLESQT